MPSVNPVVSRRRVLVGAVSLAMLGAVAAGCGTPPPPPEADELAAQIDRARADSALATAAAAAARPPLAQTLTEVAAERSAHARALEDELTRILGADASATTTTSSSTAAEPATPPTAAEVVGALRQSAESAAGLAVTLSGYRAGLLGSIAAACTAAYQVALAPPEKTS